MDHLPMLELFAGELRRLRTLDNQLRGTVVERAADVPSLRRAWESVRAEALPHGQTLKLISEAAHT